MTTPRISIALATYNGARYLRAQLDSLAAQTLAPFELVVCDDQSLDDTPAIVAAFAARAPFPVRLHVNETRLNWRANFMGAVARCTGDLIAFCDQDDIWYPEKLATVAPHFADPAVLLVHHNADLIDPRGDRFDTLVPEWTTVERIAPLTYPTPWSFPLGLTLTFRRALGDFARYWPDSVDANAPEHRAAHDQWFYYLASSLGTVVRLPDRLLGYRQHSANACGFERRDVQPSLLSPPAEVRAKIDPVVRSLGAYSRILERAAQTPLAQAFPRLGEASRRNAGLLQLFEARHRIYAARSPVRRLALTGGLLLRGGYGAGEAWKLGKRAFATDLLVGVPRGGR